MSALSEMEVLWAWFREWETPKRRQFLVSLIPRVVPNKLFAQMARLSVNGPENDPRHHETFEDQLAFAHQCMDHWSADQSNHFTTALEDIDQSTVYEFYRKIAATAGKI